MAEAIKRIFWHGDLPPLEAEMLDEHWVVARSDAVKYRFDHKTELWAQCVDSLRVNLEHRLGQEIRRLGGDYAHILDERVVPKIDHESDTYCLEGRYDYVLFRDQR